MAPQQGMYGQTPTGPTEPDAWLAALDDVRRPQLEELDARIRRVAPGLRRYVDRGFLSYGRYTYKSRAGRSGDWMCLAVASNKHYISLYAGPIGLETFAPGFQRQTWAEAASASSGWPTSTSTSSRRSSAPRPPATARRSPSEAGRSRRSGFPSPDAGSRRLCPFPSREARTPAHRFASRADGRCHLPVRPATPARVSLEMFPARVGSGDSQCHTMRLSWPGAPGQSAGAAAERARGPRASPLSHLRDVAPGCPGRGG